MRRIDIVYGGQPYSVGNRDLDELKEQILMGTQDGGAFWLEVNSGEGEPRATCLLITAHTEVALTPVPAEEQRAAVARKEPQG